MIFGSPADGRGTMIFAYGDLHPACPSVRPSGPADAVRPPPHALPSDEKVEFAIAGRGLLGLQARCVTLLHAPTVAPRRCRLSRRLGLGVQLVGGRGRTIPEATGQLDRRPLLLVLK